jgi:predicted aspartyl protease
LNDKFKYLAKEVIYSFNLKSSKCATTSNIQINEEYLDCLIDTGAFTSFISEDYCLQRNFIRKPIINRKNWVTANGNPIKVEGQVDLKIKIGEKEFGASLIVAKDLSQDVIIGVDILKPNACIIDFATNKLTCGKSKVDILTIKPLKSSFAHANYPIEIQPYGQEIVMVEIDNNYNTVHVNSAGKNTIAEIVTVKQEDNKIPVIILNPTHVIRKIRRGDIIASISPIEIIKEINNEEQLINFIKEESLITESLHSINIDQINTKWKPSERIKFTNKSLTKEQKLKLSELIDEFYMVFSRNDEDIGRVNKKFGTHDIKVTDDTPCSQRPYKTPHAKEKIIEDSLEKMLKMGIIEPSDSDWSSPIVLVKKSDGSERFCIDYRKLNKITIKDKYPMPSIESKLNKLYGSKYFTSLDCISGYWQIEVSDRAKKLLAFTSTQGLFTFNFMPFGLCNAGATFQRVIEKVIKGVENATAYVDDLLSYSMNFELHLKHLRALFERLKDTNIKVKTSKCKIACSELMFLGYKISDQGITIDESRTEILKKYPKPTKSKHVKQFLGLANFYRHFIKNFSDIVEPLNHLTRKNIKFKWTTECEVSFNNIIKLLSQKPILVYPNFNAPFILSTDASQFGIGAVLSQKDEHEREHPIHYASRSLNTAERNYSTIERELLAIVYAVDKFRYYLYGKKFIIITDHNPLVYLNNITLSSERLTRWRLKLSEYDFDIIYRKGQANANADAMSRIESNNNNESINDNIETIFCINDQNYRISNKANFIEYIQSIEAIDDKIIYNPKNIIHANEPIVVCIPSDLRSINGVAKLICEENGGISCLKRHKLKVGKCLVKENTRTVFYLITKKRNTDTPFIRNFC